MTIPAAPKTVELSEDQSADPGKCGACWFFKRYGEGIGGGAGWCTFKLPPQAALRASSGGSRDDDDDFRPSGTNDTYSCDLYRPSDVQFTKKIYWTVPQR